MSKFFSFGVNKMRDELQELLVEAYALELCKEMNERDCKKGGKLMGCRWKKWGRSKVESCGQSTTLSHIGRSSKKKHPTKKGKHSAKKTATTKKGGRKTTTKKAETTKKRETQPKRVTNAEGRKDLNFIVTAAKRSSNAGLTPPATFLLNQVLLKLFATFVDPGTFAKEIKNLPDDLIPGAQDQFLYPSAISPSQIKKLQKLAKVEGIDLSAQESGALHAVLSYLVREILDVAWQNTPGTTAQEMGRKNKILDIENLIDAGKVDPSILTLLSWS